MAVSLASLHSLGDNKSNIIELHRNKVERNLDNLPVKNPAEISTLKTLLKNFFDLVQDLATAQTGNLGIIPFEYIVKRLVQGREDMTSYANFAQEEEEVVRLIFEEFEGNQVPLKSAIRLSGPDNRATVA